jgi:FlaA1/EpsC-like NDP-sugar epimerase
VIPIFRGQIERRLPITVTHPGVTRWFMTVPEAVNLILQAVTIGKGGEVFVLDMGKPVRILDLAHSLIRQYGLEPGRDIPIVFTGLRPGERLFEKLFNDHETICKTVHPRILIATDRNGLANGNGNGEPDTRVQGHRVGERQRLMEMIESARSLADAAVATPAEPQTSAR